MASVSKLTYSYRRAGSIGVGIEGPIKWEKAYLNWQDFTAQGTTNLFILAANAFVVFCWLTIITTWTGSSSTMQIDESSGAATFISSSDGSLTNMTAGAVIKGTAGDSASVLNDVAGHDDEFDAAERTVDVVIGTAAMTAGAAWLDVGMIIQPSVRS